LIFPKVERANINFFFSTTNFYSAFLLGFFVLKKDISLNYIDWVKSDLKSVHGEALNCFSGSLSAPTFPKAFRAPLS